MFRRALCFALTVLALSLGVAPGLANSTASPKAPAKATPDSNAAAYAVSYRKPGTMDWTEQRVYPEIKEAQSAAQALSDRGYETQVLPRFAMARAPRPRAVTLPASETVTPDQCVQVFKWLSGQKDIAFRFPADGCYARAHLMVKRMQARGYTPYKVWSFANGGETLQVRTANDPRGQVDWNYHVAPALRVRFPSGNQYWYVIDPSLFTGPVRASKWKRTQMRPGARYEPYLTMTRIGMAPKDPRGVRLPGSGYWVGRDPRNVDTHAAAVMRLYKRYEGRRPPRNLGRLTTDGRGPERTWALPGLNLAAAIDPRRQLALAA